MNDRHDERAPGADNDLSRRDFVALSMAAGLAATALPTGAAAKVDESEVSIKTGDGSCDAFFVHPASGAGAGVLLWPDAFGLRPALRAMARRLAGEGYAVLVPNPFYRVGPGPFFESAANVDFQEPATLAKLRPLMASVNAAGAAERDATAFVAVLDAQKQVARARRVGTQGYCMGGALAVRTAAALPDRIGAAAS